MPAFQPETDSVNLLMGGLGAGKTELSLNMALWAARYFKRKNVCLVDLDIVNPFFRVRRMTSEIESAGVTLIAPSPRTSQGDLPSLPAAIWGTFANVGNHVVCDIGGGELGLRPLPRLKEALDVRKKNVFFVVNSFRPGFLNPGQIRDSYDLLTQTGGLKATHIIANPNLGVDTDRENFLSGLAKIETFASEIGLPIVFSALDAVKYPSITGIRANDDFLELGFEINGIPVMPLFRFWSRPWCFGRQSELTNES